MLLRIKYLPFVMFLTLASCASTTVISDAKNPSSIELRLKRKVEDPKRNKFYLQAFKAGTTFMDKTIPERMLAPWDKGNSTYVEARFEGQIVGFLRDFSGPVSPKEECACHPFSVTLVFDAEYKFRDLLLSKPLEKFGHAPFNANDEKRLKKILLAPDKALENVRMVEQVVDAATGATKEKYASKVVPQAGLVTIRLLHLIKATERIFQGAPVARDQLMLSGILAEKISAEESIKKLIAFFPGAETQRIRKQTYRFIAHFYFKSFKKRNVLAEKFLENSILQDQTEPYELFDVCYRFAQKGQNIAWVKDCLNVVKKNGEVGIDDRHRLEGMFWAHSQNQKKAYRFLKKVIGKIPAESDPDLYVKFIEAAEALGQGRDACREAKNLYASAPLFDDAYAMLKSCGGEQKAEKISRQIRDIQKEELLKADVNMSEPVPEIFVQGEAFNEIPLPLTSGKHTVLLFFATWCPHCRAEFPRIKAFQKALQKDPVLKNKVNLIAVRTAVEREKQTFESFLREFRPNFKIYTDATMSLAFSQFVRSQSIGAGLPTLVVIDKNGHLRWVMPTGTYRDTAQDLDWVLRELQERFAQ
ncbi:MAG: redoxin domain-containing protein [Myxococcota bacterium]|nr:redoxin domain-containing protein [Myxococcota bacterium]